MKGRLIKTNTDQMLFLCANGDIVASTQVLLRNLLIHFDDVDTQSWKTIGRWESEAVPNMMLYPGETIARITNEGQLVIYDGTPFSVLLKPIVINLISCYEYGKIHNVNPEYVRVLCRTGRIPGAQKISGGWMIPEDAPYPISAEHRRKDLIGRAGRPKGTFKKAKTTE